MILTVFKHRYPISLTTGGAGVRFLPSVANLVLEELPVRVEGFSTLVARECFVCCMSPFVFFQIAHVVESCENERKNSSTMTKKLHQTVNVA